jgi:hypothetical protein
MFQQFVRNILDFANKKHDDRSAQEIGAMKLAHRYLSSSWTRKQFFDSSDSILFTHDVVCQRDNKSEAELQLSCHDCGGIVHCVAWYSLEQKRGRCISSVAVSWRISTQCSICPHVLSPHFLCQSCWLDYAKFDIEQCVHDQLLNDVAIIVMNYLFGCDVSKPINCKEIMVKPVSRPFQEDEEIEQPPKSLDSDYSD